LKRLQFSVYPARMMFSQLVHVAESLIFKREKRENSLDIRAKLVTKKKSLFVPATKPIESMPQ